MKSCVREMQHLAGNHSRSIRPRICVFVIDHVYVIFYFVCRTDVGPLSLIKPPRLINHRPIFAPVLRQSWEDRDDVSSQIES